MSKYNELKDKADSLCTVLIHEPGKPPTDTELRGWSIDTTCPISTTPLHHPNEPARVGGLIGPCNNTRMR